jgi:hypothetical protein
MGAKVVGYAHTIPRTNRAGVEAAALFAKGVMVDGAVAAGLRRGGTLPAHGKAKWGARFDVKGPANGPHHAFVRYVGPVHWAFGGTKPHVIGARRLGSRKAIAARAGTGQGFGRMKNKRGAKALSTPFGPRAYVNHPGMAGRNTWPATKKRVVAGSKKAWVAGHRTALRRTFTGT